MKRLPLTHTIIASLCFAWLIGCTISASDYPTPGFLELLFIAVTMLVLGVAYLIYTWARSNALHDSGWKWLWCAIPLFPVLACIGFQTDWPMMIRVRLSEGVLEQFVASDREAPSQVGLFRVRYVDRHESLVLLTTGVEWFESGGIAYIPQGVPPNWEGPSLHPVHLYGPWYRYRIRH